MSTAKTTSDAEHDTARRANVRPVLHGWNIGHQQEDMRSKTLRSCSCYPVTLQLLPSELVISGEVGRLELKFS